MSKVRDEMQRWITPHVEIDRTLETPVLYCVTEEYGDAVKRAIGRDYAFDAMREALETAKHWLSESADEGDLEVTEKINAALALANEQVTP